VGEQLFVNAVGWLDSRLDPFGLLTVLQEIELTMGRDRARTVDRIIDLDILYYDNLVLTGADLQLPHPEVQFRRFVLEPLVELAPEHLHPLLGLSSRQMLERLAPAEAGEIQQLDWPMP
jgi:2-amino-4-hydroxy-6-hydroxymethyldihydropteridine diphosphokinase